MNSSFPFAPSPIRSRALAALLLLAPAAPGRAQDGGSATSGASQADQDVDAARRVNGGAPGAGASGTGASGTGASGTGAGIGARPNDAAGDAVDRSRQRNLPGARPGTAPAQRPGGAAVTQPGNAATDIDPAPSTGAGDASGSRPGAALGGLPSSGTTAVNGGANGAATNGGVGETVTARRDSRTTARMIGETSFAYRDRAMQMVERELAEGGATGSTILRGSEALSGAARTRVNDSMTRANEARTELAKAISRARSANESRWESSRSDVVGRYEAYAKALEDARAAAIEAGVQLPDAAGSSATMPTPQ